MPLGGLEAQVNNGLRRLDDDRVVARIWELDGSVYSSDRATQDEVVHALGWLRVVTTMREQVGALRSFADEVRGAGLTSVVLLGMGGSSLAPEVTGRVFGSAEGYPRFFMLDSTDPGTIEAIDRRIDPAKTLFIVASKSGGTVETMSLYSYYREKVEAAKGERAGENFVAITDMGTSLEKLAREAGFRRTFTNMSDIGGRYSALSYFGLVPAALVGVDLETLLESAARMAEQCGARIPAEENPGAWLGTVMGTAALAGRDKLTIFTSPDLDSFGIWAEQLIGDGTGKDGKGIVPVAAEPVGRPSAYGRDRLFVYLALQGATDPAQEHAIDKLEGAGQPVVRLMMPSKADLGAEFFRWEMAVAVAGHFLGVNVFDQPNVQESKDNTARLLAECERTGSLPKADPVLTSDGIALYADQEELARLGFEGTLVSALRAFLGGARPGDYVAALAYMPATGEHEELVLDARRAVRDTLKVATTFGYGPRYLHSTGQLHKGGPNRGLFIQVTAAPRRDMPVPGKPYTFGTLIRAQSEGDMQSLRQHHRRAIRLHIRGDHAEGIEHIRAAVKEALEAFGI